VTSKTWGKHGDGHNIFITSDSWVTIEGCVQLCILLGSTLQIPVGSRRVNISPLWGGATCEPISIKLNVCRLVQRNHVYQTWFENFPMVFPGRPVENALFPYGNQRPIKHCQAQIVFVMCRWVICAPTYNSIPVEMCLWLSRLVQTVKQSRPNVT